MKSTFNILRSALHSQYPTVKSRITDELGWSLMALVLIVSLPLVEKLWHIPIHTAATALAGGTMALLAFALASVSSSVPSLLTGEFSYSKDPLTAIYKTIAIVWLNISWLFWITISAFLCSVLSHYNKIQWIGAAVPGLALLAIFRTYLSTRESFRTYIALANDRFRDRNG